MYNNNENFWSVHSESLNQGRDFFSQEFRELFNSLISQSPDDRPSIETIKRTKWFNEQIYNQQEYCEEMKRIFGY